MPCSAYGACSTPGRRRAQPRGPWDGTARRSRCRVREAGATSPETPTFPPEASGGVYVFSHDSSRTPTRKHAVSSARHSCATPDSSAAAYEVCAVTCPRRGRTCEWTTCLGSASLGIEPCVAYACVQSLHRLDPPDQLLVQHLLGAIAQLRLLALEVVLELGDVHVIRVLTSALLGHRGSGSRCEARVNAACVRGRPSRPSRAREKLFGGAVQRTVCDNRPVTWLLAALFTRIESATRALPRDRGRCAS